MADLPWLSGDGTVRPGVGAGVECQPRQEGRGDRRCRCHDESDYLSLFVIVVARVGRQSKRFSLSGGEERPERFSDRGERFSSWRCPSLPLSPLAAGTGVDSTRNRRARAATIQNKPAMCRPPMLQGPKLAGTNHGRERSDRLQRTAERSGMNGARYERRAWRSR
jgi:hypothetical protein